MSWAELKSTVMNYNVRNYELNLRPSISMCRLAESAFCNTRLEQNIKLFCITWSNKLTSRIVIRFGRVALQRSGGKLADATGCARNWPYKRTF